MGDEAGSADLVIDETNQATGKRVFPRSLGAAATTGFPVATSATPTDPDPDSSPIPIPTSKRPFGGKLVKPLHSPGCPE